MNQHVLALAILIAFAVWIYLSSRRKPAMALRVDTRNIIAFGKGVSKRMAEFFEGFGSVASNHLVNVHPIDAEGNPAPVQGDIIAVGPDGAPATIRPATLEDFQKAQEADPNIVIPVDLSGWFAIIHTTPIGETVFNFSADADLGEGTKNITVDLVWHTVAAEAAGFGITFGPTFAKS